jgi:hypothetical protein
MQLAKKKTEKKENKIILFYLVLIINVKTGYNFAFSTHLYGLKILYVL